MVVGEVKEEGMYVVDQLFGHTDWKLTVCVALAHATHHAFHYECHAADKCKIDRAETKLRRYQDG